MCKKKLWAKAKNMLLLGTCKAVGRCLSGLLWPLLEPTVTGGPRHSLPAMHGAAGTLTRCGAARVVGIFPGALPSLPPFRRVSEVAVQTHSSASPVLPRVTRAGESVGHSLWVSHLRDLPHFLLSGGFLPAPSPGLVRIRMTHPHIFLPLDSHRLHIQPEVGARPIYKTKHKSRRG